MNIQIHLIDQTVVKQRPHYERVLSTFTSQVFSFRASLHATMNQ